MKLSALISQTKSFESEQQEVYLTFLYASKLVESRHKDFFKGFGITMQQYNVLRILKGIDPQGCSLQYIRERLLDKESDTSRVIERMKKQELVVCSSNLTDKRKSEIRLTPLGASKLAQIAPHLSQTWALLNVLEPEEQRLLKSLLEKLLTTEN